MKGFWFSGQQPLDTRYRFRDNELGLSEPRRLADRGQVWGLHVGIWETWAAVWRGQSCFDPEECCFLFSGTTSKSPKSFFFFTILHECYWLNLFDFVLFLHLLYLSLTISLPPRSLSKEWWILITFGIEIDVNKMLALIAVHQYLVNLQYVELGNGRSCPPFWERNNAFLLVHQKNLKQLPKYLHSCLHCHLQSLWYYLYYFHL